MTLEEQLSEMTARIVDFCDDYDKKRMSTGDIIYHLWEQRRILENIIIEERYDSSTVPQLMWAIDGTIIKILEEERNRLDNCLNGRLSMPDKFFKNWKMEE